MKSYSYLDAYLSKDRWMKNQAHQIILALHLTTLKFNDTLIVIFYQLQSNGEQSFGDYKFGIGARP